MIWGLFQATRPPPDQLQGVVDTDQVNAATKVLSRVEKLLVREGDQVQAGQTLAVLSSPEAEGGAAQAQAALSGARALQDRALNGDRPQDISALEAAWRAAQAQADLASTSARRADNLFAEGVIAAQRRDEADAARASAAQNAEAAHQLYLKAIAGVRSEDKQVAASQVAGAEAGARVSASLLDETRLVAPISGEIDKKYANPGEIVLPSVPVFTLIDLGDLWVSVNVREDEFRGVGMGRTIQGSIPALGLKGVPFKIDYISPQGDFATWRSTHQSSGYDVKSFEVRARPVHPVAGLRPGMSVLFPWPQG
ncbi:MAG: efflux RND transporter periplasmic adaptor subunit [Caulobacteraceae bacterium]